MKFWKHLRWLSSLAFVALLLWGLWAVDGPSPGGTPSTVSRPLTY